MKYGFQRNVEEFIAEPFHRFEEVFRRNADGVIAFEQFKLAGELAVDGGATEVEAF